MKIKIILLLSICLSAISINAQATRVKVPAKVKPFIEQGSKAIALESADLNGDKIKDYILVLERKMSEAQNGDFPTSQRPLLILVSDKNKKLTSVIFHSFQQSLNGFISKISMRSGTA